MDRMSDEQTTELVRYLAKENEGLRAVPSDAGAQRIKRNSGLMAALVVQMCEPA